MSEMYEVDNGRYWAGGANALASLISPLRAIRTASDKGMGEAFHISDFKQNRKPWADPKDDRRTKDDEEKKNDALLARHSDGVHDCFICNANLRLRRWRFLVFIQPVLERRNADWL